MRKQKWNTIVSLYQILFSENSKVLGECFSSFTYYLGNVYY